MEVQQVHWIGACTVTYFYFGGIWGESFINEQDSRLIHWATLTIGPRTGGTAFVLKGSWKTQEMIFADMSNGLAEQ